MSVKNPVGEPIPAFRQPSEETSKRFSSVNRQHARDIFPNHPSGASPFSKPYKFKGEVPAIVSKAFAGKTYVVLGLARTGLATVEALVASGARVLAWDTRDEARALVADKAELVDPLTVDLHGYDGVVVSPGVPLNRHPIADKALVGLPLLAIAFTAWQGANPAALVIALATAVIIVRDVTMTVIRLTSPDGEGARVSSLAKLKTALELVVVGSALVVTAFVTQMQIESPYSFAQYIGMFETVWVAMLVITAALSAWTGYQYLAPKRPA